MPMSQSTSVTRIYSMPSKYSFAYKLILIFLCLSAGIPFYEAIFALINDYGSGFAYTLEALPFYLCFLLLCPASGFFFFFALTDERSKAFYLSLSLALSIGGFLLVFLDAVFVLNGTFSSLLEGTYSALYPLDTLLIGLFIAFLSLYGLYKWKKSERKHAFLGWRKLAEGLGKGFMALVALFFAGDLLLSFLTMDFSFAHAASSFPLYMLALIMVIYVLTFLFPIRRRGLVNSLHLGLTVIFAIWFGVAYALDPYFLNLSMVAFFPIDFMGSLLVGPTVLILVNLIPALLGVGSSLLVRYSPIAIDDFHQ